MEKSRKYECQSCGNILHIIGTPKELICGCGTKDEKLFKLLGEENGN